MSPTRTRTTARTSAAAISAAALAVAALPVTSAFSDLDARRRKTTDTVTTKGTPAL